MLHLSHELSSTESYRNNLASSPQRVHILVCHHKFSLRVARMSKREGVHDVNQLLPSGSRDTVTYVGTKGAG